MALAICLNRVRTGYKMNSIFVSSFPQAQEENPCKPKIAYSTFKWPHALICARVNM